MKLLDLFKLLFSDLTPEQLRALNTVAWRSIWIVHIAWACGWLATFNLGTGFALAADFEHFKLDVKSVKLDLLEQQLWDVQILNCQAIKTGQPNTPYYQRLSQLQVKYRDLTGQNYPAMVCLPAQ